MYLTSMHNFWSQSGWLNYAFTLRDILDVLLVAFLIYQLLRLVHGTRAVQMVVGIWLIAILYQLTTWLGLTTVPWLLRQVGVYLGFGVIILFQDELRVALISLGKNIRLPLTGKQQRDRRQMDEWYEDIVIAATTLSSEKTGALIVIEREVGLRSFIEGGVKIDARLVLDLLVTIFNPETPLHDGAVIISNQRVAAASCFLPLTQNPHISRELGTRHRAGIGVTEDSDAVAVIVSEETGAISFAIEGRLIRNLDGPKLRRLIAIATQPWRSEKEAVAIEEEERARQTAMDEVISASRKRNAAGASSAAGKASESQTGRQGGAA